MLNYDGWVAIGLSCEIGYCGLKMFLYSQTPDAKEMVNKDIQSRKNKGGSFPRLRAYAPLYLPFPLDICAINISEYL